MLKLLLNYEPKFPNLVPLLVIIDIAELKYVKMLRGCEDANKENCHGDATIYQYFFSAGGDLSNVAGYLSLQRWLVVY